MNEPFFEPIFRKLRFWKITSGIPDGSILCDVGCGPRGALLFTVKERISRGYGFDRRVEDKADGKITLKNLDMDRENIPLDDNSMDAVTSLAVLEHLDNPRHILGEIFRILKPGGTLLLTTPTPAAKPVLEFLAYRAGLVSRREIDEHKHYFNLEELRKILEETGFRPDNINCRIFQLGFNNFVKALK